MPQPTAYKARLFIVMGVSGCGKSTIAHAVASRLGATFIEGDMLHPPANRARMRTGRPLHDHHRQPWLDEIAAHMHASNGMVVASCSALKRAYRKRLIEQAGEEIVFVYLKGSRDLIAGRLAGRRHHFMPATLLDSQFAALEEPAESETHITVSIDQSKTAITDELTAALRA